VLNQSPKASGCDGLKNATPRIALAAHNDSLSNRKALLLLLLLTRCCCCGGFMRRGVPTLTTRVELP